MPVWHERTKEHVVAGRLAVLGITQEQHPARCRLFAQWKGIDWPILWDPFNLTGSKAVPNFTLVDAHGVVRVAQARPDDLAAFLDTSYEAPGAPPAPASNDTRLVAPSLDPTSVERQVLETLLYDEPAAHDAAVTLLTRLVSTDAGVRSFRLGVAFRIRYDGAPSEPGDFARALDNWTKALRAQPDQYIWRRRIQQYGPRPDKPYPFYDWVERARADLTAEGQTPVTLPVPLTETERNVWREATADETEPDPHDRVPRAAGEAVAWIDAAVAWSTTRGKPAARVHLRVVPVDPKRASFDAAEEVVGWVRAPVGDDWQVAPRRIVGTIVPGPGIPGPGIPGPGIPGRGIPGTGTPGAAEGGAAASPVLLEFELTPSEGAETVLLEGYVLLPVCRMDDGRCLRVRQSFRVLVPRRDR